ncbi:hypothetical protein HYDPIDRAFT_108540 [Hydnomerulius pinastri MD-312]|nr:hypothetical protein HYDPIDRAFT_108540 [Hydnomerulius pinastri MD-312]
MPRRKPPLSTSKTSYEQDEYYLHWQDLEAHDEHLNPRMKPTRRLFRESITC